MARNGTQATVNKRAKRLNAAAVIEKERGCRAIRTRPSTNGPIAGVVQQPAVREPGMAEPSETQVRKADVKLRTGREQQGVGADCGAMLRTQIELVVEDRGSACSVRRLQRGMDQRDAPSTGLLQFHGEVEWATGAPSGIG
jgi:hypothetical protein